MCAISSLACVIPPTLEEEPPSANLPPAILREDPDNQILPAPGLIRHNTGDPNLVLDSIPVSDPDVNDVLTLRLLLDEIDVKTLELPPTGDALRVFRNVVVDDACALIDSLPDPAGLLVGVVSDGGFKGPGREAPAEVGTSSVEWVLECVGL